MAIGCFGFDMMSLRLPGTISRAAAFLKSKRAARFERPDDQNSQKPKIFAAPAARTRTYNNTCTCNRPWPDCELKAAFDRTNLHNLTVQIYINGCGGVKLR